MNWRNIVLLSLLSVPVALAAVFGLIKSAGVEMVVWLVVFLATAWLLRHSAKPFLSGLTCALLMAAWQHLLNIALWDTYVANNPGLTSEVITAAAEKNISVQVFQLISAPMVGLTFGLVLGLLTWGASKLPRRTSN